MDVLPPPQIDVRTVHPNKLLGLMLEKEFDGIMYKGQVHSHDKDPLDRII